VTPMTMRRADTDLRHATATTRASLRRSAALLLAIWLPAAAASAQTDLQPVAPAAPQGALPPGAGRDCSRWPQSAYDEATGSCVCPSGLWWNLRGDACLPKEHAAGEFCTTVWPGSEPFFVGVGGYRCVCAPPLLWDEQATACRSPIYAGGEEECQSEWPGTLPVLSPSGTESECRCPGGRRWDEASRSCVPGAPVISQRAFVQEYGAPAGGIPIPPPPAGYPSGPSDLVPGGAAPGSGTNPEDPNAPGPGTRALPEPGAPPAAAGGGPGLQGIPSPPPRAGGNSNCDALLAEIRSRAAAGDSASADALGMKAAVSGCDPNAISEAARTK
jgi:hypothetical protein